MSVLRRLARRLGGLVLRVDETFTTYEEALRELEAHATEPGLCAVFDPEGLHLLVMTRERFLARCERRDRAALERAPTSDFAIVLMSGTRVAPRAVTLDELKFALKELEAASGR